ncbi:hypothetical protein CVIRNUC_002744 [Coccomyxa viridis]|uniref:GRIP domain-containing protein n=1 Tax=Coccomyxa viridis TaxID=1274662 RepID=A0AAV1I0A8_9CHLO|nr:hypothetical protein CVIRNUC_002744 [Coccomyxa viridis]
MSKFNWQSRWQETVGKTVTGLSDGAARLKQNWADRPATSPDAPRHHASTSSSPRSSASASQEARFLSLPIDTAKKLRWYDREDLSQLISITTREKQQLQDTVSALRQVILAAGVSEQELDADLQERLAEAEHQQDTDASLNSILVLAAQAEIDQLRNVITASSQEPASSEPAEALQDGEVQALRSQLQDRDAQLQRQEDELQELRERLLSVEAADAPSTPRAEAKRPSRSAPEPAPRTEASEDALQLSQEQPSSSANGHPPQHGVVDTTPAALMLQGSQSGLGNGHYTEEASSADVDPSAFSEPQHQQITAPASANRKSADQAESDSGQQTMPLQAGATLAAQQPGNDQQHAEVVELQRQRSLEIEAHLAQVRRLESQIAQAEAQAHTAEEACAQLQREVQQLTQTLEETGAASELHVQELRAKVASAQASQAEMLQRAQDICSQAEERAAGAERRADRAEDRASKAEAELKARERAGLAGKGELAAARRAAGEREAELRQAMREGEAKLRERIGRLDDDAQELRRSLVRARADAEAMEARAHQAESAEASLAADLRNAEAQSLSNEGLVAKCATLEERLSEMRAEQGQLATYKEMAAAAEADRGCLEQEVLATAQLATALEARLRGALGAKDAAESRVAASEMRAYEAEAAVESEVARRLELCGADFRRWPRAARDEVARLEKKLEAAQGLNGMLHAEVDAAVQQRQVEAVSRAQLQVRLSSAEERATKAERERKELVSSLERQLAAARTEILDWRRELAAAEAERDRLGADRKALAKRASSGSLYAGYGGTPKARGGGSLRGVADGFAELPTNGDRDHIGGVDIVYLKNVLLKFLDSLASGRTEQSDALLPAIATLLRATPQEFRELKLAIVAAKQASWWPA